MRQGDMRGAEHHGKGRAVFPRHRRRHRHAALAVGDNLFGIAAVRRDGDHPIAEARSRSRRAQFQHLAGDFEAGTEGRLRLLLVLAAGDQAVGEIDPAGADPDAHLAGTGARLCNLGQAQPSWTNEFMADDGLHGSESSIVEEKKPFSIREG
jgi:hypothetical protein